jgi:hypothetical protein
MGEDTKMTDKATRDSQGREKRPRRKRHHIVAPALEAAAKRLDRLVGGGIVDKDQMLHSYTNPC